MAKKKSKVKVCDELWALAVKKKGQCEVCGATHALHAHHVIPRTNYATRYMIENGVCLCYKHHIHWAHKDALAFADWFRGNRLMDSRAIEERQHFQIKNDYTEIEENLKKYLEL